MKFKVTCQDYSKTQIAMIVEAPTEFEAIFSVAMKHPMLEPPGVEPFTGPIPMAPVQPASDNVIYVDFRAKRRLPSGDVA